MLRGSSGSAVAVPEGVDVAALAKVLANPEMAALLKTLAKSLSDYTTNIIYNPGNRCYSTS